jgi:hypothetical protein
MKIKRNKNFANLISTNFFISKKGVVSEYLPWLLIAIAILVILVIAAIIFKDKALLALQRIKNIFRI